MKQDTEFGYKARQILNQGVDNLDGKILARLNQARQTALNSQRVAVRGLRFAGVGYNVESSILPYARTVLAVIALVVGATGTHYWNAFEQAREFEEIDSALLADDLPPSAYLDRGFHAWLEHASNSSSQ
ncbi:MAG: DUF3619 family protein [Betaproteobacteria bacterium]|nr:DUF3619 family protein [Betaproteobacteria bacterium]